jgi:hypothetical protein
LGSCTQIADHEVSSMTHILWLQSGSSTFVAVQ